MGKINDLSQGNLSQIWDAIRKLQYATNQNAMAIGRGGLNVYGGGGIVIENGGLYVTGSATISGVLNATGSINMAGTFTATGTVRLSGQTDVWGPLTVTGDTDLDGPTTISGNTSVTGDFTVTGPTNLNGVTKIAGNTTVTGDFTVQGPMKTTGTLSVEGITTLKNDLNITSGGKIKAGAMTIDPGVSGGALSFAGGPFVAATAGSLVASAPQFILLNADTKIAGAMYLDVSSLPTTSQPANLRVDPSNGAVYRSTA